MESALKLLEDALREAPDAIVVCDADARITFVNRAARRLAGRDADATDLEFTPESWGKAQDAQGRTIPLSEWSHSLALRGSPTPVLEARIVPPLGEPYDIRISSAPLRDASGKIVGAVTQFTDITTLESQRFIRQVADSMPSALYVFDLIERRMVYANPQAEALFSNEAAEGGGTPLEHLVHPDDLAAVRRRREHFRDLAEGEFVESEFRIRSEAGTPRWLSGRETVIRRAADGAPERILGIAQDITDRRALQEHLLQAEKLESIGRLAGGVAHDFNNLLTVIIGISDQILAEGTPSTDGARPGLDMERVESLRQAAEQAAQLTRQLLAFARRQRIEPCVVDLNELMGDAERILRRIIGEEIELVTAPLPGLWPVRADPGRLMQVIVNLAVNARDAMPRGGRITLGTEHATLGADSAHDPAEAPPGEYVVLVVADNGIGMTEEVRARVFDPFFTTKELGRGTGLGLASVYGTIRQSEGYIGVASMPGSGTTFRVLLPRSYEASAAVREAERAEPSTAGNETILVVEDNPMVRRAVVEMLRARGYAVLQASGGDEADRIAASQGGTIDLLLTDIVMPGTNGAELALRLRARTPRIKVLFMSGYAETAIEPTGGPGPAPFLQKPFTAEMLARRVRETLDG